MQDNMGASADADQALVQAPSPAVSALTGFDPSRGAVLIDGRRIMQIRWALGMSQGTFGALAGVSGAEVGRMEREVIGRPAGGKVACLTHRLMAAAIAFDTRQGGDAQQGSVACDESAAIAQHPAQDTTPVDAKKKD